MKVFKKIISIILRIGISIVLLIFLFRQVDNKAILDIIKTSNKSLLITAFFTFFLNYLLCLFRWEMLLKASGIHLPLKRVIIAFTGGTFFNLFLPTAIGGDFVRSVDLAAHTKKAKEVIATVFLDRLSGFTGLVIVALLALMFGYKLIQDKSVIFALAIITLILLFTLLILFNTALYSRINKFLYSPLKNLHQQIHIFRHRKEVVLSNLFLSLAIQSITPLSFYIIALALGIKISIVYFFVFLPIVGAITLLPISIGGLGLRDATIVYFFIKVGVAKDLAFAMSLLAFFYILIYAAICGLIYVLTVHHRRL